MLSLACLVVGWTQESAQGSVQVWGLADRALCCRTLASKVIQRAITPIIPCMMKQLNLWDAPKCKGKFCIHHTFYFTHFMHLRTSRCTTYPSGPGWAPFFGCPEHYIPTQQVHVHEVRPLSDTHTRGFRALARRLVENE